MSATHFIRCFLICSIYLLSSAIIAAAQSIHQDDSLLQSFLNPPKIARPRVWWHWMNGNITEKGITADLEWMKRVGIGGAQIFDVDLNTPQIVPTPLIFMSPGWKTAFRHAGLEAQRLGLDLGMASSGGWSESGSPWITPEEAMKHLVFSDTAIQGGKSINIKLPLSTESVSPFYRDCRLLAFRVLDQSTLPTITNLAEKAQYRVSRPDGQKEPTPTLTEKQSISANQIIDLTAKLQPDSHLACQLPAGRWELLRLGYIPTGRHDRFGTKASGGLEVDKLSSAHALQYLDQWVGHLREALGSDSTSALQYLLMDSWEVGVENWTEEMIPEFQRRRGYNPTPYLPVLTGYVVGSADQSDRFLWDFRRTLADLLADEHYGVISDYVRSKGLKGVYAEAIGVEQPTTGDGLQAKGRIDIPMGEFVLEPWRLPGGRETNRADLKEAASASHIYGKPLAAAEAFTTTEADPWAQSPYDLKPYADWAFSLGINQMVIHTSAHQPFTDSAHKPGITLSGAGQNYTRNNTWAEQSLAFNDYLARCSYLLQQGSFVADLLYYYGEDVPVVVPYWKATEPAIPGGYDNDWINTEILMKASVQNNNILLPDGMSYRMLIIPNDVTRLTVKVIRKLAELVKAGATLLAPRPGLSPSLFDYPNGDDTIRLLSQELWGAYGGYRRYHEPIGHNYGKGAVYSNLPVRTVMNELGLAPDFRYSQSNPEDTIVWIHRRTADADIYFIANQQPWATDITAEFRVTGREAELWHPDNGLTEPAEYSIGSVATRVPVHLDPRGSVFVIFRKKTSELHRILPVTNDKLLITLSGSWQLSFLGGWAEPTSVRFDSLFSWTRSADTEIRYFSGTVVYNKDFNLSARSIEKENTVWLDLGTVKELAEVWVNNRPLGIYWKPPYCVDITPAIKSGKNHLEVRITNLWPNRLIGDEQPGAKRYTFSLIRPFKKDSPLLESGLLGPVKIYTTQHL